MLDDINSNIANKLASNLLGGTGSAQSIAKTTAALKDAYGVKDTSIVDEGQISQEAIAKYKQEQEIERYKAILNEMMGTEETPADNISALIHKVKSGDYKIDDATLAQSILTDIDARNLLG